MTENVMDTVVHSRNPAERWQDRDTRKSAIDAFCWQCMGGTAHAADGAQREIRHCASGPGSINPCPLWHWRPYK
jgi:hypothetical protein